MEHTQFDSKILGLKLSGMAGTIIAASVEEGKLMVTVSLDSGGIAKARMA